MHEDNEISRGKGYRRGKIYEVGRGVHRGMAGRGKKINKNYKGKREKAKEGANKNNINFNRINYNQEMEYEEEEDKNYNNKNQYSNKQFYHNYNQINNNYNYYENKRPRFLSYPKIREMEGKDSDDIINQYFLNDDIYEEISNTRFQPETCYLMMKIIIKISENNSEYASIIINKLFENTNFFSQDEKINKLFCFVKENKFSNVEYLDFLKNVIEFLTKCLIKFQRSLDFDFNDYKEEIEYILQDNKNNENNKNNKIMEEIKELIEAYIKQKKIINREKLKKKYNLKEEEKFNNEIEINYKGVDAIINSDDFTKNKSYTIYENKIKGKYESYDKYINTMFFLEYEDCYRNLRKAIYNLIQEGNTLNLLNEQEKWNFERKKHDIYCYLNGNIIKAEMNKDGIFITMDFTPLVDKKIKFTKRMINGSLVIITNNKRDEYLLATVSYNPYIEKKLLEKSEDKKRKEKLDSFQIPKAPIYRIKFELINITPKSFKFIRKNRTDLQLFESKAYFQSYIHILER